MKEKELKPCPFCGGKSWVLKIPNESNKKYVVVCKDDDCGASLGEYGCSGESYPGDRSTNAFGQSWRNLYGDYLCLFWDYP